MNWRRLLPGSLLPLCRKELVEMAARRRTYIIRFSYALLLFVLFLIYFRGQVLRRVAIGGPSAVLGVGEGMFGALVAVQFITIFTLLPASMSMAITQEKERDSLSLLLLTGLRPWEIVIEKYISRLIPIVVFLLLSMPLMALCYSLGGVDQNMIFICVFSLLLTCLQVGAVALFLSAFFTSTAAAFIGTYVLLLGLYFVPAFGLALMAQMDMIHRVPEKVAFSLVPMALMAGYSSLSPFAFVLRCIPVLLSVVAFLVLARMVLVRRAFLKSGNAMMGFMRRLDRFWFNVNKWAAGGIIVIKDRSPLPVDDPVAWREVSKRSLGKVQHLLRMFIMMEAPVVLAGAFLMLDAGRGESELLATALFIVWGIVGLIVVTQAANLISSERVHQSLEVLLTTPIRSIDILKQKMRAMRRVCMVLALPILTVYIFEAAVERSHEKVTQFVVGLMAILIYLPMLTWFGCWLGLRIKRRSRAVMAAVILLVVWCVGPVVIALVADQAFDMDVDDPPGSLVMMASPAVMLVTADLGAVDDLWDGWEVGAIFLNFLLYAALAAFFRGMCVHRIDEHLGRVRELPPSIDPGPPGPGGGANRELLESLLGGPSA